MAYPYYVPGYQGYQPMYSQPVPDQLQQLRQSFQQPQNNANQDERIWVQGIESAKAYLVAPNSFVRLWDTQTPMFYEKRADASGKPYMEIFEYSRKSAEAPNPAIPVSVGRTDYEEQIKALEGRIEALEKARKEGSENE